MTKNLLMACAAAVLTAPMLTACGDDGPFITVYNAQHEELISEVAPLFEKETGIDVKLRSGDDLELANQLVQEGDASPRLPMQPESPDQGALDEETDAHVERDRDPEVIPVCRLAEWKR